MTADAAAPVEERFLTHLGRSGDLVGARRLEEAEVELLRALSVVPGERRALNLLALVRFKLGRVDEAHDAYREIVTASPGDASARLNLGLIALKLERIEEAVSELELAGRIAPEDLRVWSYLGYAYTRKGMTALAAAAFRRAGQSDLAAEIERSGEAGLRSDLDVAASGAEAERPADAGAEPAASFPHAVQGTPAGADWVGGGEAPRPGATARPGQGEFEGLEETVVGRVAEASIESLRLANFVLQSLAGVQPAGGTLEPGPAGALRFSLRDEGYVRGDCILATTGALSFEAARRRVRGRFVEGGLGQDERPLFRVRGAGELWLALPPAARKLVPLLLEDDILYVREDRVVAFDGEVSWEAGRLPQDGLRLVQFRGRGRVAVQLDGAPLALRLEQDHGATVARSHMLGWIGRVQPHGLGARAPGAPAEIACQGEGVVVVDVAVGARPVGGSP